MKLGSVTTETVPSTLVSSNLIVSPSINALVFLGIYAILVPVNISATTPTAPLVSPSNLSPTKRSLVSPCGPERDAIITVGADASLCLQTHKSPQY